METNGIRRCPGRRIFKRVILTASEWMPWNYRETLARSTTPTAA